MLQYISIFKKSCGDDVVTLLSVLCIIMTSMAAFLAVYLCYYKRNLRNLRTKLEFILRNDTNQLLSSELNHKDMVELINLINENIVENKKNIQMVNRTNRRFRESISNISHDLRTPLTLAGGYIQMLSNSTLSEEKKKEYYHIVDERIQMVRKLLDQLFEYARIESGELLLEQDKVNLTQVLYECLALYYEDYKRKNVTPLVEVRDKPYYILGDKEALTRIFSNIIVNSLVHGEDQYEIKMKETKESYHLTFSNFTSTIEVNDMEYIFERFYTSDKSRNKKTTGLGLSIAKHLTKKMGGQIDAVYQKGKFEINLSFPKQS